MHVSCSPTLVADPFAASLVGRVSELLDACKTDSYRLSDHSLQVANLARLLAEAEGYPTAVVEKAWLGGFLHDCGKVLISRQIHFKPGPLANEERAIMRRHPELGAALVASLGLPDIVAAVRHHHEHFDGSGYPAGLRGKDIPALARLVAVADHYVAMREERCYRPGHSHDEALASCLRAGLGHLDVLWVSRLEELPSPWLWRSDLRQDTEPTHPLVVSEPRPSRSTVATAPAHPTDT